MITEIKDLKIEIEKIHTIFIPIVKKDVFNECKHILLDLTQQRSCFYINSRSVCNRQRGTTLLLNTNSLIDLEEDEEHLIEDMKKMCQCMANVIKKSIYYQVKGYKNIIKSFKISPEIQCHIQ